MKFLNRGVNVETLKEIEIVSQFLLASTLQSKTADYFQVDARKNI